MKLKRKKRERILSILLVCVLSIFYPLVTFSADGNQENDAAAEEWDEDMYGPKERIHLLGDNKSTYFNHGTHTKDLEFSCDECHDELFDMEAGAAAENGDFNMKSLTEGKYCGACHDGDTAFEAYSSCGKCHVAPEGPIYFTKPVLAVIFDHKTHLEGGIECEDCHKEIFTMDLEAVEEKADFKMDFIYCTAGEVRYCGNCHNGEIAFPSDSRCNVCHIGVKGYRRVMGDKDNKQEKKGHH